MHVLENLQIAGHSVEATHAANALVFCVNQIIASKSYSIKESIEKPFLLWIVWVPSKEI